MFTLNDDLSIYATRGDIVFFSVGAEKDGAPYSFKAGDVLRIKVFGKKDAESVFLQKDFPVTEDTDEVEIFLTEEDTKLEEVISKPKDYWYEVELNPYTNPQTIIGYDEDGAKVFKLFPEGADIPEWVPEAEDVAVMDEELSMVSTRPVQNQAIARAFTSLRADYEKTKEDVVKASSEAQSAVAVERARIDQIINWNETCPPYDLEYLDFISEETKNKIDGAVETDGTFACITVNLREANLIYGGTDMDVFIIPKECRPVETGLIHTEDGLEYRINYDTVNNRYVLNLKGQNSVSVAPSGAGTVTFEYPLGAYELKDIRVGADGTAYDTAGEAVRQQIALVADGTQLVRIVDFSTATSGYVNSDDYLVATDEYWHTDAIHLNRYEKVAVTARGYKNIVSMIAKVNGDGYTSLVDSVDSVVRTYEYTATEECDIVISYYNGAEHSAKTIIQVSDRFSGAEDVAAAQGSKIEELEHSIWDLTYAAGRITKEDVGYTLGTGEFAFGGSETSTDGKKSLVADAACTEMIAVNAGEKYFISTRVGPNVPAVVFYSEAVFDHANYMGCAGQSTTYQNVTDLEVDIPSGVHYIVVNTREYTAVTPIIEKTSAELTNVFQWAEKNAKSEIADVEYDIEQLDRRLLAAEKANEFVWGDFDKAYFVFVHDDTNAYLQTAYNVFHAESVPLGCATIVERLYNTIGNTTAKEILDNVVLDGGEVLAHYSGNLLDTSSDELWYEKVVSTKKTLESNGYTVRGLILADSSDRRSNKGEKFCRRYYEYADKVGTSLRFDLGRNLLTDYASVDNFKAAIDRMSATNGIYAFGFHGTSQRGEEWLTESALAEIVRYIKSKDNCAISTYSRLFDEFGTTKLEKAVALLERSAR